MSEMINNREYRQKVLKEIIHELHAGKTVDEVKPRFEKLTEGVSTAEIAEMEQALIMEGMPVQEIQRLCDVHASLFKGSIEDIHKPQKAENEHGHPVHIFKLENREIEKLIEGLKKDLEALKTKDSSDAVNKLMEGFSRFTQVDRHYSRKENLLFPYMEKYGITAPPKVMWGVDDEIRDAIKDTLRLLERYEGNSALVAEKAGEAINKASEMVYKEENILFPMVIETLTEDEWLKIAQASDEIGFCFIEPNAIWAPERKDLAKETQILKENQADRSTIPFDAGFMTPEECNAMLNTLPVDITFVDKDGAVKYFTQGKERIFARPKTIIGRQVGNCHPPASVHIVEQIVEDLKSGKKDHEDFWIKMGEKYVLIRYFAVRNAKGEYLGTMEFTQDIAPIQRIIGEKRLAD